MMRKKWIILAPLALAGFLLFIALGGVVVRQLWNWLLPSLFGFHQINFWQALGLLALCRILFGGFGFHGRSRSHAGRRMRERWQHMTPEEREQFRQRIRTKWGFNPPSGESKGEA
jgi:hypothetical protein